MKFYVFITVSLTIKLVASINPLFASVENKGSTCEWIGSDGGQAASCLPGWYINGICESQKRPNCKDGKLTIKKYTQMMKCCQMKYSNDNNATCSPVDNDDSADKASLETCPNEIGNDANIQILSGVCSSERRADCNGTDGNKHYNSITCCQTTDMSIANDGCGWKYGGFGEQLVCPSGYAAAGVCGAGKSSNKCNGFDTGIYCCLYSDHKN